MKLEIKNFGDLENIGIYKITNIDNNKIYIGSTLDSFKNRWYNHIQKLRHGTHPNNHLQNAFIKYGENCFLFSIEELLNGYSDDYIISREQYYLDLYKSYDREIGYNIEKDVTKREVSEETKRKISETLKEGYASGRIIHADTTGRQAWNKGKECPQIGETRRKMFDSIEVYNSEMNLIVTFRSVTDLCEWSETNNMPFLRIDGRTKKGGLLRKDKIYYSIRENKAYKGLYFKRTGPLSPEMGIAKWENCGNGEILNPQPSQPLTKLEGSETND